MKTKTIQKLETEISAERERQVINAAAKITKRLEGDEVVIEIRMPAYIYSDRKEWKGTQFDTGSVTS